jgi:uncharacterized protein (TIGR02147 family)
LGLQEETPKDSTAMLKNPPKLFQYLNFRKFLKDWYDWHKEYEDGFSLSSIQKRSGLASRSHFFDICYGRKLTEKFVPAYIKLLDLSGDEIHYFKAMVVYEQGTTDTLRAKAFETMAKISPQLLTLQVGSDMMRFFEQWYQPVLLTILAIHPSEKDPSVLASLFNPKITELQCVKALKLAQELGVLEWDPKNNIWHLQNRFMSCAESTKELALKPFHRKLQEFGIWHYDHSYEKQHFSTLSIATTEKIKLKIEDILRETRSKILELVKQEPGEDTAFQVNFQVYPLSRPLHKRRSGC